MKRLLTVEEVAGLITSGQPLLVAGAEALLRQLPRGRWVGGTIPYFMDEEVGRQTEEKLQVTVFPADYPARTRLYSFDELPALPGDYPASGLSLIIIPSGSPTLSRFAKEGALWPGFFDRPLAGWVAGVRLDRLGVEVPRVFDGATGAVSGDGAAVLHVELPAGLVAKTEIINLFEPAGGDVITFPEDGFAATDCFVNGQPRALIDYLTERQADPRWPLVCDFGGSLINVAFQTIDPAQRRVTFYSPVFAGAEYRLARPLDDYERQFQAAHQRRRGNPRFECNCVLNYLYADLEGHRIADARGPFTFGEIAWMLLNQTVVSVTIEPLP
jgi:hypothetical protein